MNPDEGMSRYYIEDTFLLNFLVKRYAEMLQMEQPRLVSVWGGLGLVALAQNKELQNAFNILISSSSYTSEEVLTSSIDLFLAELDRLEAADTADYLEKKVERHPMSPRTARKLLYWSWTEGRKMSKEQDFKYYSIWELISWLVLTSDEEIKEFEENCRFSESPPEVKVQNGLQIVKKALWRAVKKSSRSFQNNDPLPGNYSKDRRY
jgi:hypothetical protein